MQGVLYRLTLSSFALFCALSHSAPTPRKVVFGILAGYSSCKNATRGGPRASSIPMANAYAAMVKNLQTKNPGLEVTTLYSCLNGDAPPDGEAEFVLSTTPRSERYGDTKDIRAELEAILKANPNVPIFLVGHSYGGWMSMYLTQTFAGKPNLKALFTIDPIGPECGMLGVVFGGDECHSAPTDLENDTIKKRAATWVNFFQKDDSWLTSSEVPDASENHEIQFNWGPHSQMNVQKKVWDRVEAVVQKAL